jgi:hypothetical protein
MARFITFTEIKHTASGDSDELVFLNIDMVSTARYRSADDSLALTVQGTRDGTGAVEHYVLRGKEAKDAMKVLHKAK